MNDLSNGRTAEGLNAVDAGRRCPEDLDRDRILAGLATRAVGRVLHVRGKVGSTNDVALALADAGAPHGTAVVADVQTHGRGRLGRGWLSPPGLGLWVSVVLRPRIRAAVAPTMTLAAGLAVAEAIELAIASRDGPPSGGAPAVTLKWPNDVFLAGRKVGGILVEMRAEGRAVDHLIVGIGVNVCQSAEDFPPDLAATATSIGMATGAEVSRGRLLQLVFARLEAWTDAFAGAGPEAVVAAAAARMPMLGKIVVASSGTERWEGRALRLDPDGALVVETGEGTARRVLAAEVTLKP